MVVAALGTLGSALMRMSIEKIGTARARDARASFHQQRAGYGAAEVTSSAVQKMRQQALPERSLRLPDKLGRNL
jgi:hypothetical protein